MKLNQQEVKGGHGSRAHGQVSTSTRNVVLCFGGMRCVMLRRILSPPRKRKLTERSI